ncbi:hypothetical protein GQY15_17540 [Rhodobacter sphaeroides]|uniref:hypothetical protein n=1 Tax=Cereibacter sphaeroides TaxID=1063 RepID=UPI00132C48BF|nr:hypothetical protein [Cereibacter sphaeroides]MWP39373.1 hypothetical protein [Cereibacter sphaeroides]
MGETLLPVPAGFNRSQRVESHADRLTGDPSVVLLREVLERSGIVSWTTARLKDTCPSGRRHHDLASLIQTAVSLAAQGFLRKLRLAG